MRITGLLGRRVRVDNIAHGLHGSEFEIVDVAWTGVHLALTGIVNGRFVTIPSYDVVVDDDGRRE